MSHLHKREDIQLIFSYTYSVDFTSARATANYQHNSIGANGKHKLTMKIHKSLLVVITCCPGQYVCKEEEDSINIASNHAVRPLA
jgi:hypothetical protein